MLDAEAEYTFRLHKPIIPLRLEQRYLPDGWLGALCGNNLIYDFSVPAKFEDSFIGLTNGLGRYESAEQGLVENCWNTVHLSVTFYCFTLSSKPNFSENLILYLSLFLSV